MKALTNYLKRFYQYLLSKHEQLYLNKYYTSIKDMPMYNWINIFEYMDLSYISKTGKLCKRANKIYEKLSDELIDEFGISEDFLKVLKNKIKIELYYNEQMATGNNSNQIFIEILEIDNEEITSKQTKGDLFDSIINIEKYMGFYLDPKKITVFQFHKYAKKIANKVKHENNG